MPADIAWRIKEQFDEGSGTVDMLEGVLTGVMGKTEMQNHRSRFSETQLRSAEECHYHRLFMEAFEHPELVLANVARWAERPSWNTAE